MDRVYRYRVKGSGSLRLLARMAWLVNFVWNYVNDAQRHAVRWGRPWLTGYDINALTDGASKELGLNAQTIQAIGQQYASSRATHRKRWLRYRGARALGWVPFKASGIKQAGNGFKFMGHVFRVWLSRPVAGRIKCGSFAQDSLGHWYINLCVDVPVATTCGPGEVGIDLGLKTTATMSNGEKYDGVRA